MGIKLANLAPAMAEILEYPEATAGVVARFGRDAGLLTSGSRGRHVPDATALDAARLLIAMMLTQSPARATEIIRDFGQLEALHAMTALGPNAGEIAGQLFPARQPLDLSVARIIAGMGDADFAKRARAIARVDGHAACDPTTMFPIDIEIRRGLFEAEISFCDCGVTFAYKSLNCASFNDESEELASDNMSYFAEAQEAGRPYASAVKSTFRIEVDVLMQIAEVLHGVSFAALLDAASACSADSEAA